MSSVMSLQMHVLPREEEKNTRVDYVYEFQEYSMLKGDFVNCELRFANRATGKIGATHGEVCDPIPDDYQVTQPWSTSSGDSGNTWLYGADRDTEAWSNEPLGDSNVRRQTWMRTAVHKSLL